MISVLFLLAVANDTSFHFFLRLTSAFSKVLRSQGLWITVKAKMKCEMYHIIKLNHWRATSRFLKLINRWNKGNKRLFKHHRVLFFTAVFLTAKTEVKPEFSKRSEEVLPRSIRRYKLRFHRGIITENAPILSSGTVWKIYNKKTTIAHHHPLHVRQLQTAANTPQLLFYQTLIFGKKYNFYVTVIL